MRSRIQRQSLKDSSERQWQIALVPVALAEREDARFWWEELSAEQRVDAVHSCLESALKTRGIASVPRLRRVARLVQRRTR